VSKRGREFWGVLLFTVVPLGFVLLLGRFLMALGWNGETSGYLPCLPHW